MDEAPHSTEIIVLPASGEVVDLNNAGECARALQEVRDLESALREAKGVLTDAIVAQSKIAGTKTLHIEGVGKVEVKGGKDLVWDPVGLKQALLDAGMPRERVSEIVVETIDYKVVASEARKAGNANPDYRRILEQFCTRVEKRHTISLSPK